MYFGVYQTFLACLNLFSNWFREKELLLELFLFTL
jgi:hypothetical protein